MKHRLTDGAGYLIIDHSNSPGIDPIDVPIRLRNSTPIVGEGKIFESEALNCSHCQRVIILNQKRTRERAVCLYCYHYVCDECNTIMRAAGQCIPFKKILDQAAAQVEKNPEIILTDS